MTLYFLWVVSLDFKFSLGKHNQNEKKIFFEDDDCEKNRGMLVKKKKKKNGTTPFEKKCSLLPFHFRNCCNFLISGQKVLKISRKSSLKHFFY